MGTWVWKFTPYEGLFEDWEDKLTDYELDRDHHEQVDDQWVNLDTGASVVLVSDGSWKRPETARFRLFSQSPAGAVLELEGVLDPQSAKFDTSESGASCYAAAHAACKQRVETVLQVRNPDTQH